MSWPIKNSVATNGETWGHSGAFGIPEFILHTDRTLILSEIDMILAGCT